MVLSGASTGRLSSATTRVEEITAADEGQSAFVLASIPYPQLQVYGSTKVVLILYPHFRERQITSMKITRIIAIARYIFCTLYFIKRHCL
jgi:hypothetical protein